MIFENIYNEIISSFSDLWKFKERGKTLEIITPFATTSQRFISLFLTNRDGEYIVSDGGWISQGLYDNIFSMKDGCFERLFEYYKESFRVSIVMSTKVGISHFYKKTNDTISIPSIVFDMASFVSAIISASNVEFKEIEEESIVFRNKANSYIKEVVKRPGAVDTRGYLDKTKAIRFSAIVSKPNQKLAVINYITGNSSYQFTNSVGRAHLMFGMAEKSPFSAVIDQKISVVNDQSVGYRIDSSRLEFALNDTHSFRINWVDRERLTELLN